MPGCVLGNHYGSEMNLLGCGNPVETKSGARLWAQMGKFLSIRAVVLPGEGCMSRLLMWRLYIARRMDWF